MDVLVIGSGGREHALAWAISKSALLGKLYAAPGNGGIAEIAECVSLEIADHAAVAGWCRSNAIGFVVIGPEVPLVAGLADALAAGGIAHFGPSKAAARLEGSKAFTKNMCREFGIPTAAYGSFTDADAAKAYVASRGAPVVVKADGLAAGKGVIMAKTNAEAMAAIDACFGGELGEAGRSVVIEEWLQGEEASFFALVDGKTAVAMATAQDHKRAFDGDEGPNTGGMGAYSPAPVMTPVMIERTMKEIVQPTVAAMRQMGSPFRGVLFAGLMITADGPKLIEYNVRFGDPETQVLMMRLKSDLLTALVATADGTLDRVALDWREEAALTVVMAAKGYPGHYDKGSEIKRLAAAATIDGVRIFHAGTANRDGRLVATGGRVLNVTAIGRSVGEAKARAYSAIARIDWPGGFCRSDIGARAVAREEA